MLIVVMTAVAIMQKISTILIAVAFMFLLFPIVSSKGSSVGMVELLVYPLSPFVILMVANSFSVWIFYSVGRGMLDEIMCQEDEKKGLK